MVQRIPDGADVVIVTALPLERDAVLRHLRDPLRVVTKNRVFYHAEIPAGNERIYQVVLLSLTGMGNVSAAVATSQAIDVWNPEAIVLTGITGAVRDKDKRSLGDLIVAEQVVAYEPGKHTPSGLRRRFEVFRPSHELLVSAREFSNAPWASAIAIRRPDRSRSRQPTVHFGVSAAGEKVIANREPIKELQKHWSRLLGIEMEGVGVALAAYQAEDPPGVLQIKAISDWADSSKNDNWQPYAAEAAATFTCAFIASGPFKPSRRRKQPVRKDIKAMSGRHKIRLCQRLGSEWQDLADYFEIPLDQKRTFPRGRECQGIWEWLELREKLSALFEALKFIDREDLVELLQSPVE